MSSILITMAAGLTMMLLVVAVWAAVHLLARRQVGERKLGCKGGKLDAEGNVICCGAKHSEDPEVREQCQSLNRPVS